MARAAREIAALADAAGYDGAEFDMEGIGKPYQGPAAYDYGTACVSCVSRLKTDIVAHSVAAWLQKRPRADWFA